MLQVNRAHESKGRFGKDRGRLYDVRHSCSLLGDREANYVEWSNSDLIAGDS